MKIQFDLKSAQAEKQEDEEDILTDELKRWTSNKVIRPNKTLHLCILSFLVVLITAALAMGWIAYWNVFPYLVKNHDRSNMMNDNDIHSVIFDDQPFYKTESESDSSDYFYVETSTNINCPLDLQDELKFDCFPQQEASEELCLSRGCCWAPNEKSPYVPFCYYPSNYALYSFVNISLLNGSVNGIEAYMQLIGNSGYPEDISLLKMIVTYETRSRLRVRIMDAEHRRYQVTMLEETLTDRLPVNANETDYEFVLNADLPGFSVLRKSNKQLLFNSIGIGGFIYANQFLQITSLLPSSNIYGLGEHQDSLKHSMDWQRMALFAHDEIPNQGKNLYGSHPFYLVMENDGSSHGVFLKNSDPMDVILQPAPAITFRVLGGIFDFYFFLGPTPSNVIEQYTEVIGRPAMPPYWGLGFHLCRYNYGSLNRTREIWSRNREAGIPFDVQWNDLDYMDMSNDFTYDHQHFDGLPDFVRELHALGMHYIPLIDPGISNADSGYVPYDQGIALGIFIRNSTDSDAPFVGKVWNTVSTVWPDFTHPNVTEYWTNQLQFFHDQIPFDGAWIDMNEPANFYSGSVDGCPYSQWDNPPYTPNIVGDKLCYRTLCMSAAQYAGRHYDVHNLYGLSESIATNFALKQIRRRRPFIISRSTFPGQGRFGGHWSGDVISDWTNLRRSITSILNYNMYGIPLVGADICGFNGDTTPALCQRWMELGAFYPFSRNHNTDDAIDQDPVALGPSVVEASKKALNIRYSLLPYLYTLFWAAHVRGSTVARPLFFEFPHDPLTYTIDTQFLWGEALMIAPVFTENVVEVEAYLPKSLWYDYYDFHVISSGGKWQTLSAPLDTIPLLIRGGFILPLQTANVTTTLSRQNPCQLLIALNETQQAVGELYWDDGDTIDAYQNNLFHHVRFEARDQSIRSEIIHWSHVLPTLHFNQISVLGIRQGVSVVRVNGLVHNDFIFDLRSQALTVRNLNAPLAQVLVVDYQ